MSIPLVILTLRKIGVFDLSLLNLDSTQIEILDRYVFENYTLMAFLFIIHIPSIFLNFLGVFYIFFYLYELCLLKCGIISNIKSPMYDYYWNESRSDFFKFYMTYIKASVFSFFHNFFDKNSGSKLDKINKKLSYAYNNILFLLLMPLLPPKHLVRIILFFFDIFWNFKKWRYESRSENLQLLAAIFNIIGRKSSIIFLRNLTIGDDSEDKIYIFNSKFTSRSWTCYPLQNPIENETRSLNYSGLSKRIRAYYSFNYRTN
jgi:hypothetical protein